jgi:hypothetical protein
LTSKPNILSSAKKKLWTKKLILFEISAEFRMRIAGKIIHLWSQQESELKINSVIFRAPKRENKFTCMRLALAGASSICFSRSGNYGFVSLSIETGGIRVCI